MTLMMLANMFGVVLVALLVVTVTFAFDRPAFFLRSALTAVVAWMVASPWIPPSLLFAIRRNESGAGETPRTIVALAALTIVAIAFLVARRFAIRYVDQWPARWMLIASCIVMLIPALAAYTGLSFVPQPGRYKIEAELAIVWTGVFALGRVAGHLPLRVRVAVLSAMGLFAVRQTLAFRHTADALNAPGSLTKRIEYRSAEWIAKNLPGQRIMAGGGLGNFLNVFTDTDQLSAQPYTTALNWQEQVGVYTIYRGENAGDRDAEYSLLWLKAFGVQAIAVPGPASHEYWKPFARPNKFDGLLPVLWRDDDTTINRVPQSSESLAHVLQQDQLVHRPPVNGLDTAEVARVVAALDASTSADFHWCGSNCATIRARLVAGDIVSTQINYHPGWHAIANGIAAPIRADGLGLMTIDPHCVGECEIRLQYDGGWELRLCRALSAATILLLIGCYFFLPSSRWTRRLGTHSGPRSRL
jgi:hypothetical protein